jgi:hypothetical protein
MMVRVIAIVFVISLFVLTSCSSGTPLTKTTGVNSASSKSANGLNLSLSLDSSTYQSGQKVTIVIDEKNTLKTTNKVTAANKWPLTGLSVSPCGPVNYPFGVAILQGFYNSADILCVMPLKLYNPEGLYSCPMILSGINEYDFRPSSDAAIIQTLNPDSALTTKMSAEVQTTGYWTSSPTATLTNFDTGVYTVVGGDEWGTIVIVHFTVSKTSIITTTSITTVNTTATTQNQQPIEVVSASGPLQPYNPGGPIVAIILKNTSVEPVVSLAAVFTGLGPRDFKFNFNVSASNPMLSNTSISDSFTLIGAGFNNNVLYPLTITGTLQNGVMFSYIKQVEIAVPSN